MAAPPPAVSTPAPASSAAGGFPADVGQAQRLEALYRLLADRAERFDFFQALRLLENAHADKPRIGASLRPRDDMVRLAQTASLSFAASALDLFEPPAEGRPARLKVNFLGLLGPNGPLPLHLTEYVRDRLRNSGDPTLARFLDVFHHRMLQLFYRAWASAQPVVGADRPQSDRFAVQLGALFGQGGQAAPAMATGRSAARLHARLQFAGRLGTPVRNADGLRALLQSFFEVPLRIEQLVGHWMAVPVAARSRLGGPDAQLGVSALAGTRVWQAQHKIRLVAGPLDYDDYCRLLPGGASLARLGAWVRDYVGPAIDWDLRMTLKPAQIPPLRLGTRQGNCTGLSSGTRLGWTTWLGRRAAGNDTHAPTAHALLLRPAACQAPSS